MNLLPIEDQLIFKKEFKKKAILIAGLFIFFAEIVFLILLLPSYIFLTVKAENFNRELAIINRSPVFKRVEEIKYEMSDLNSKINLFLEQKKDIKDISAVFKNLVSVKPLGVTINFLDYKKQDKKNARDTVLVRGEAASRKIFLDFLEKLKKDKNIMDINSPVSNLLKESDIKFSFTIFLSK
jgi:hypothetical protein